MNGDKMRFSGGLNAEAADGLFFPGCRDCLLGLAATLAELSSGEDEQLRLKAYNAASELIKSGGKYELSAPEIANGMIRLIKNMTGVEDPYDAFKKQEIEKAKQAFESMNLRAESGLRNAVISAALGNSLDFFKDPEQAFEAARRLLKSGFTFHHDDIEKLERRLAEKPGLVLYLTDNSGEAFFDIPLYHYLTSHAERTIAVVKGGPGLNDLTQKDILSAGLSDAFQKIMDTGVEGVGIDWNNVSQEFKELFNQADLVISKGMANFETMYPRGLTPPVFFIFKVKCAPMQDYLDAPANSYWALWKEGS